MRSIPRRRFALRTFPAIALLLALLLSKIVPTVAAQESAEGPETTGSSEQQKLSADEQQRIADLILQLEAKQFAERRKAYLALRAFGPLAIGPLRAAAEKGDPEVVTHAVELIEGWSLDSDRRVFEPASQALADLSKNASGELARRSTSALQRHRRHRRGLAQTRIQEMGGTVNINAAGRNREYIYVQLSQNWTGGEDLSALVELGQLQSLTLASNVFTDKSLEQVAKFDGVSYLSLQKGRFTKKGFDALSALTDLQSMSLAYIAQTEGLGDSLKVFKSLSQLSLQYMDLSKADLDPLRELNLRNLTMMKCTLNDSSLDFVSGIQSLYYMNLQDTELSVKNIESLAKAPGLNQLNIRQVELDKEKTAPLKDSNVSILYLYNTGVTGPALEPISEMMALKRLTLSEAELNDEALPVLKKFKKLEYLSLQNTKITARGGKDLTVAVKPCRVSISPRR